MWFGHASASIISTPFCSHNFLNISPISFFSCPYISFLLYFGANTIWYSQRYFECAVLFISFFIYQKPPCCFSNALAKPLLFYNKKVFYLLKFSIFPQYNWGFIFTHKCTNKNKGIQYGFPYLLFQYFLKVIVLSYGLLKAHYLLILRFPILLLGKYPLFLLHSLWLSSFPVLSVLLLLLVL